MIDKEELLNKALNDKKSKKLIAVSGGPDSMFLLNLFKEHNVVVAHVNYNKREDSNIDETIVRSYCKSHSIPYEIYSIKKGTNIKGNFQDWARKERYHFFKQIYDKYQCDYLLLAHHKDDFLETAIMQKEAKRKPEYFGIRPVNSFDGMQIIRPLIFTFWKDEIQKECIRLKIKFAIDSTNDKGVYARNIIRQKLKKFSRDDKEKLFSNILIENQNHQKIVNVINTQYELWKKQNFACDFIRSNCVTHIEVELVYKLIHENFANVKISTANLLNIVKFIKSTTSNSKYKIKDNVFIVKKKDKLLFLAI
ncbi:tRNA(Ile)-lysidine synthase [Metamycoplasma arthritidis]|uniref:tRNA(Ile)-lysidine synthase n=1 Tax=Metamycoplasma arthritidis (strain 158L3-1) TaxID=243272 RepID=B3PNH2_META1|nr:tRNA lysidine(34) synthetase TilS [Metamycoplasma arthritidis]ACF07574.1 PP-loop superfamily ATPase/cell cycle protein [Metamycoplasma arthritidis 158L3-1]VEU79082.1 tRNA(Ile)-lysidine synthase [Metamycoplasma arthritidis]